MITVSLHSRGTELLCSGCSRTWLILLPMQSQDDELERLQIPLLPIFRVKAFTATRQEQPGSR